MEKILSSYFCQFNLSPDRKLRKNMWILKAYERSVYNKGDSINF